MNQIRLVYLEKLKLFSFVILLIIAFLGEDFDLSVGEVSIQRLRAFIGLNLPITPFTTDMTLLGASARSGPFYLQQYKLMVIKSNRHSDEVSWDFFNVYNLKHYITWFIETRSYGLTPPAELSQLICANISAAIGQPIHSWLIQPFNPVERLDDTIYAFDRENLCPLM